MVLSMEIEKLGILHDPGSPLFWLQNKLGTNEAWTSISINSQLNPEVLKLIRRYFVDLGTPVKLKLLLSFFHIPRRTVEEWRQELDDILEIAQADGEPWVATLAEIMKPYPHSASLNLNINVAVENRNVFHDLVDEITKELKRGKDLLLLPMECHYLNKQALATIVGQQKAPIKHFSVRKKPKSAALRSELMVRATEAVKTNNTKKIPAPTIPLRTRGMPRKMTDTTPLKGLPSQQPLLRPIPATASRSLSRTPAGKKEGGVKLLEITEQPMGYALAKRRKKMQDLEESKKDDGAGNAETPDYAVGLQASVRAPTPPPPTPQAISAPPTPLMPQNTYSRANSIPEGPPPTPTPQISSKTDAQQTPSHISNYLPVSITPTPVQKTTIVPVQTMTKTVVLQVPQNQTQQVVTLSKELMEKAQEIFRTANKATRPEKEHILKFMAGTRDNPCPELGSIVTIKLSEQQEELRQKDGRGIPLYVETHFQMNYNTGEWKVIQKPPKVDTMGPHQIFQSM